MPITPTAKIWMDGELVDWQDATVHVLTHSLHYGTAVFEGIRAYPTAAGTAVFRLREHVARLLASAHLLALDVPYGKDELVAAVLDTVASSGLDACYIRPLVYLGYGEMGLNPLPCEVRVAVAVWPWGAYLGEDGVRNGIRLKVSSWARLDPRTLPTAAKATGMYMNSSLAKVEAVRAGYDEALMCTTDGYVAEGTGENLFLVRRGEILTPPSSAVGALEGITADSVRTIAQDLGYEVREVLLRRSDLYLADEAFLTGTAAEVVPISSVDDRLVADGRPGPVTTAIQEVYFGAVRGEVDRYKDWLERVV
ncbi:MAG TPA: branched-chain amino acid transaminase [Acidimicrobiales bacterium]|nr:branched-chain amino acid transaminase [Acidimicrobiales bacterium]